MSPAVKVDRAALVRRALVELVAANGFRGTSMAAIAERAGVATGTAYVHYESKDDLVMAAYAEVKAALGAAGTDAIDPAARPPEAFRAMWHAMRRHLAADPVRARFLVQVQVSPYAVSAHQSAVEAESMLQDPRLAGLMEMLIPLPPTVLYDLGLGPAVRLVAAGDELTAQELDDLAAACWRAIGQPA